MPTWNNSPNPSWLKAQSFSLKTRANYLRDLGILFNFALCHRWTSENPCAFIEKPSELEREVSALTPEDSSKLLAACPDAFLAGVCLKLFAGLRTSELLVLDWSEISASEIVIRGAKAKTRQRRIVAISENLAAWLQPLRKRSGRVAPFLQNAWHRSLEAIAESAGLALPPNILRHSFGSYHFAQHRNENLTAAEMGNSPAMVFQHYRAVVTSEAAARFWSLAPRPNAMSSTSLPMLFVEFPAFTRAVTKFPDDDYAIFQRELVAGPEQGALIRSTGGFRKARMAFPSAGFGKSGDARVIYLYLAEQQIISS